MSVRKKRVSAPTPEERARIVNDMLKHGVDPDYITPPKQTQEASLVEKAKKIHFSVMQQIKTFIKTVGYDSAMDNQEGLKAIMADYYISQYRQLDKEELLFLLTMLHVEIAFEQI